MTIDRFSYRQKKRLAKFAARSERIAQLATSFPLLFFALATRYGTEGQRRRALELVEQGRRLREVAAVMQLPMALRHAEPEMLTEKLPRGQLTEKAAARLVSFAKAHQASHGNAISVGFYGSRLYCDAFGVWLAHVCVSEWARLLGPMRAIAIYAWATNQKDDPGLGMGVEPWNPDLSPQTAYDRAREWGDRLERRCYFGEVPLEDHWMRTGSYGGYVIEPLLTYAAFEAEIKAMQNCLKHYAPRLANGNVRLYSVRRGADKIGTVEVVIDPNGSLWRSHFLGPRNTPVPDDAFKAVQTWWLEHKPWVGKPHGRHKTAERADSAFAQIADRYLKACGNSPELWSHYTFNSYLIDLELVARSGPAPTGYFQFEPVRRPASARKGGPERSAAGVPPAAGDNNPMQSTSEDQS